MNRFAYVFQITKLITFEVSYYVLGSNKNPYFSTSSNEFCRSKRDYIMCGQAQEELLPHGSIAYKFYKDFDKYHLKDLDEATHKAITQRLEELKKRYNYIEKPESEIISQKDNHISFYETVKMSKLPLKRFSK